MRLTYSRSKLKIPQTKRSRMIWLAKHISSNSVKRPFKEQIVLWAPTSPQDRQQTLSRQQPLSWISYISGVSLRQKLLLRSSMQSFML